MNSNRSVFKVLLIDDDRALCCMLQEFLASEQIDVMPCHGGEDGLRVLAAQQFDLLILDIMLPGMNGLDVLKQLRRTDAIPVIMLTARGEDVDRIIGLEFGADDYLAKPFNPRELAARIKAIMRRSQATQAEPQTLRQGGIELDARTRRASIDQQKLLLTGTEFEILRCLLETPGQVVSKERLSEQALGRRLLPYDRSIDTHISNLRGKLEMAGSNHDTIRNQRGVGYLLVPGT